MDLAGSISGSLFRSNAVGVASSRCTNLNGEFMPGRVSTANNQGRKREVYTGEDEMSAQQPTRTNYGISRQVDLVYEQAVEKAREALKQEGFGVLSEIDIKEKFKEKLGINFRRYVILGACNPPLAHKTLQEDLEIGLLLPCNVVVYESDDADKSVVAAVDARAMLSVVGNNPTLNAVASEVNERLLRVVNSL